jgi:hypothetical protein
VSLHTKILPFQTPHPEILTFGGATHTKILLFGIPYPEILQFGAPHTEMLFLRSPQSDQFLWCPNLYIQKHMCIKILWQTDNQKSHYTFENVCFFLSSFENSCLNRTFLFIYRIDFTSIKTTHPSVAPTTNFLKYFSNSFNYKDQSRNLVLLVCGRVEFFWHF